MSDLAHLMSRIVGTPLMMAPAKLEPLLGVMQQKLSGIRLDAFDDEDDENEGDEVSTHNGIAVIPVLGTLVRRSSYLTTACGMTSYDKLLTQAQAAFIDPSVNAVLLEIDSGGGEAGGVFDTAYRLRDMAKQSKKPLWAIANEGAMSAAYAIGCAADQVFVTTTAEVGSIGVVACHLDQSQADAIEGMRYTYLFAGEHKVDGNPHQPLSDDVKSLLQADIDALYGQFVHLVATLRGMSEQAVIDTQAKVFRGADAVAIGLADDIKTKDQVLDLLLKKTSKALAATPTQPFPPRQFMEHTPMNDTNPTPINEAMIKAQLEQQLRKEMAELNDIAAQAKRLGVSVDPAQALADGVSPDALRAQVLKAASEKDAVDISAAHSISVEPQAKAGASLLDAVKKVAGV